jgi:hypothetical protein
MLAAALLLLVALGLLAGGLAEGSATLQWASFAASGLTALLLVVGEIRQRRTDRRRPGGPVRARRAAERPDAVTARAVDPTDGTGADAPPQLAGPPVPPPVSSGAIEPVPPFPADDGPGTGAHARREPTGAVRPPTGPADGAAAALPELGSDGEPPVEAVEVTDLLLVLDLTDAVLVVDEHPRYHLPSCPHLAAAQTIPIPLDQARADGFTPCGTCAPDRTLAARERSRRASG